MSYEYVVDLLEYDFSACQIVRTWQEVWSSLASLEYATWDQASCEVTCETRAPQSGCCSSYGVDGYALEYTTYNFRTCASSTECETIPPCDTVGSDCCNVSPRFYTVTLSGLYTRTNPPDSAYNAGKDALVGSASYDPGSGLDVFTPEYTCEGLCREFTLVNDGTYTPLSAPPLSYLTGWVSTEAYAGVVDRRWTDGALYYPSPTPILEMYCSGVGSIPGGGGAHAGESYRDWLLMVFLVYPKDEGSPPIYKHFWRCAWYACRQYLGVNTAPDFDQYAYCLDAMEFTFDGFYNGGVSPPDLDYDRCGGWPATITVEPL